MREKFSPELRPMKLKPYHMNIMILMVRFTPKVKQIFHVLRLPTKSMQRRDAIDAKTKLSSLGFTRLSWNILTRVKKSHDAMSQKPQALRMNPIAKTGRREEILRAVCTPSQNDAGFSGVSTAVTTQKLLWLQPVVLLSSSLQDSQIVFAHMRTATRKFPSCLVWTQLEAMFSSSP